MAEYITRVQCGHPGCTERMFFTSSTRKEQRETADRYPPGKWFCSRHTRPDEVLSEENRRQTCFQHVVTQNGTKYWARATIGSGFTYGPGFKAFAEDFPEGTRLLITAEIILPEPSNA